MPEVIFNLLWDPEFHLAVPRPDDAAQRWWRRRMTLHDEGKQIRSEVSNLRPDKRRRYPMDLRRRILDWVARAKAAGKLESECGHALGVKTWRLRSWRKAALPAAATGKDMQTIAATPALEVADAPMLEVADASAHDSLALVRIDVPELLPSGLSIVAPSGYRVEGLSLEQAVTLLRELA